MVHLVASRSYVTYNKRQLDAKLFTNPYTFVHVINPEWGQQVRSKPNSPERFAKIREKFDEFISMRIFMKDEQSCFYLYRQQTTTNTFTGIIGCASAEDYFNGTIKKHEQTLARREEIFKKYLKICRINAEPVLLSYPDDNSIENITDDYLKERPEYDFTTTDRVRHQLWVIENTKDIQKIQSAFAGISSFYIADGHHRCASSALLGKELKGNESSYILCLFMPENQLKIWEHNRLVKDLNGLNAIEFVKKLEKIFNVEERNNAFKPASPGALSMYLSGKWFELKVTQKEKTSDSELLTEKILQPILGIKDLRTDKRIAFIGGNEGAEGIQNKVDSGKYKVGFGLFPIALTQLKNVADSGQTLPPKSTWVEPKLRSALTIYEF